MRFTAHKPLSLLLTLLLVLAPLQAVWAFAQSCDASQHVVVQPMPMSVDDCPDCTPQGSGGCCAGVSCASPIPALPMASAGMAYDPVVQQLPWQQLITPDDPPGSGPYRPPRT